VCEEYTVMYCLKTAYVSEKTLVDALYENDAELRQAQVCVYMSSLCVCCEQWSWYSYVSGVNLCMELMTVTVLIRCSLSAGFKLQMTKNGNAA